MAVCVKLKLLVIGEGTVGKTRCVVVVVGDRLRSLIIVNCR